MEPTGEDGGPRNRPIGPDERSGVLHPGNLRRYAARWVRPDAAIADVVEQYWQVTWSLAVDESIAQRIITTPAVTFSIEEGHVPAPLVVTGVYRGAWMREIAGSGAVFGIRLRPAGLAVLSDLTPDLIADATLPLTRDLDARAHTLLQRIADADDADGAESADGRNGANRLDARVRAADRLIRAALVARPIGPELRLANAVLDELGRRLRARTGPALADHFGVSERAIQRALKATLGQGPKWASRWIRLQEVARVLSQASPPDTAALAVELGYSDQAHLVNDFRDAVGVTPGRYASSLRVLSGG